MTIELRFFRRLIPSVLLLACAWPAHAQTSTDLGEAVADTIKVVKVDNDFYEIKLRGDARQFTIQTGVKHAAGGALNVIYDEPSSYFTVRAYGSGTSFVDYIQSDPNIGSVNGTNVVIDAKQLVVKSTTKFDDGFRVIYSTGPDATHQLEIIQDIRLEGLSALTASVRVTTRVTSQSSATERVAVRYLWDYEIGSDDGPKLVLEDGREFTKEEVFDKPTMKYFFLQDNNSSDGKSKLRVRSTVDLTETAPYAAKPTRLTHACWETARLTGFDYEVDKTRLVSANSPTCDATGTDGDNAMLFYFGHDRESASPIKLDQTRVFTAFMAKERALDTAFAKTDTDKDGLYDAWETGGVDLNGDGTAEYTLEKADKDKKNLYIYYDWVGSNNKPSPAVLKSVSDAFANAPEAIVLTFKEGREVKTLFGKTIDANIGETDKNGNYSWEEFSGIKAENFPTDYWPTHRYMLLADAYGGTQSTGSSGMARGIPSSDFMVTVGNWGSTGEEADREVGHTIMHELGHTLNLLHGGDEDQNRKPNYLSVMNYSFQLSGIPHGDGIKLDYSRFGSTALNSLNESALSEESGIAKAAPTTGTTGATGGLAEPTLSKYKTLIYCGGTTTSTKEVAVDSKIDWNCDGVPALRTVAADVNPSTGQRRAPLQPSEDWSRLDFTGGAIGQLGAVLTLALHTNLKQRHEPTKEEHEAMQRGEFIDNSEYWDLLKNGSLERLVPTSRAASTHFIDGPEGHPLEAWEVSVGDGAHLFLFNNERDPAADGDTFIAFLEESSIFQTVATEIGEPYVLTFALSYGAGSTDRRLLVQLNGEAIETIVVKRAPSTEWKYHTVWFVAGAAETKVEFRHAPPGYGPWLDDIRLEYDLDLYGD